MPHNYYKLNRSFLIVRHYDKVYDVHINIWTWSGRDVMDKKDRLKLGEGWSVLSSGNMKDWESWPQAPLYAGLDTVLNLH